MSYEIKNRKVKQLVKKLRESGKWNARKDAAFKLMQMERKAKEAVPYLIKALREDESSEVRYWAASALRKIHELRESIPALIEAMLDDESPQVRSQAAHVIGFLGRDNYREKSFPALLEAIKDEHVSVRYEAIRAMEYMDLKPNRFEKMKEKGLPILLKVMIEEEKDRVRSYAAKIVRKKFSSEKIADFIFSLLQQLESFEESNKVLKRYENALSSESKAINIIKEKLTAKKKDEERKRQEREAEEERKKKEAAEKVLAKERSEMLKKIIKNYSKISLDLMAQLLEFKGIMELQKWIMDLPGEQTFFIEGSDVIIPRELQTGTTEAEEAINALLQNFEEFEKKGRGKL